jgi:hypothetical protein
MAGFRFLLASATLAALLALSVSPAAAGDICTGLEARLASLERGQPLSANGDFQKYDAAVNKQRSELDQATAQARQGGCMGGFLFFQPRQGPQCAPLMATINRMRVNLAKLSAARDRAGAGQANSGYSGYDMAQQRAEVLRALAYNQCGDQYTGYQPREGGLFGLLFGQRRGPDPFSDAPQVGTYRTLCVRTCDGYYFPISFSTVQSKFAQDEQLCQSMCPGTEVSLYIHRNPGEDSEQMVSLAGQPYTALPTAFKYRKEYNAACTCHATGMTAGLTPANPDGSVAATMIDNTGSQTLVPVPEERPSPGEDPETLANRAGGFTPAAVTPAAAPVATLDPNRHIRIVGPEYYVAQ